MSTLPKNMALQPKRSHEGHDAGNQNHPTEAFSSGIQTPGQSNNSILPNIGTIEKPPSSTVDNINSPSKPNQSFLSTQEPQRSIAEMERERERVLASTTKERLMPAATLVVRAWKQAWLHNVSPLRSGIIMLLVLLAVMYTWISAIAIPIGFVLVRHCMIVFRRHPDSMGGIENHHLSRGADSVFLFICGSGGHTNEMLRMLERSIPRGRIGHRRWAIGADDTLSHRKVLAFEQRIGNAFNRRRKYCGTFNMVSFNRARHVHQGWLSTFATAIRSICDIIEILIETPTRQRPHFRFPNVVVTDGPGTGFLFLMVAHLMKVFCIVPEPLMTTVYVESWARVRTLSLSAKLAKFFDVADVFIVQHRHIASPDGRDYTPNMTAMPAQPHIRIPRHNQSEM